MTKGHELSELSEAFSRSATWRRVTGLMGKVNKILSGINFVEEVYQVRIAGRSGLNCDEAACKKKMY